MAFLPQCLPEKSKVLVLVPLMRLPGTKEAINQQELIDPDSLRSIEKSERQIDDKFFTGKRYNVLNLNTVNSPIFYADLRNYIMSEKYEYVIFDEIFAKEKGVNFLLKEVGATVKEYEGENVLGDDAPIDGRNINLRRLLSLPNFGPNILINKIDVNEN